MIPAPARAIPVSDSIISRSPSTHPLAAAASIVEYSPDTW